jgi:hypothetical protein
MADEMCPLFPFRRKPRPKEIRYRVRAMLDLGNGWEEERDHYVVSASTPSEAVAAVEEAHAALTKLWPGLKVSVERDR